MKELRCLKFESCNSLYRRDLRILIQLIGYYRVASFVGRSEREGKRAL